MFGDPERRGRDGGGEGTAPRPVTAADLEAAERALPPETVEHIHRLLDQKMGSLHEEVSRRLEDAGQNLQARFSGDGQ